jgi:hemerythrin-like domain-containing protein
MIEEIDASRRGFFQILGTAVTVGGLMTPAIAQESRETAKKREVKATPPEDLMREHGVLDRVLLIYEAAMRKFSEGEDFDPDILTNSAQIVRDFIENYHEKSEEEAVFPRFKKAGKMVDLVDYLLSQHFAGRTVTDTIFKLVPTSRKESEDRRQLVSAMQAYITIYRPHAAREDTDLFPKLKDVVSPHEYDAMAEDFEKKEHALFGDDGFEKMVNRVAKLEQAIGIRFTAR